MRKITLLIAMLVSTAPAFAQNYLLLGTSQVNFSANDFDRRYEVEKTNYKSIEFGKSMTEDFDVYGLLESKPGDDTKNMYLRLGIKGWYLGYETGGIQGRIVGDQGTDFGSFKSKYQAYYVFPRNLGSDLKLGGAVIDYSTPYLFAIGNGLGNELPAFQDEKVRFTSLGAYFEYNPVRGELERMSKGDSVGKTDWYFMTRSTFSLARAKASEAFNSALNTDGTWYGFGLHGHYELGVFHAGKLSGLSYSAQAGYYIRAHQYSFKAPWEITQDTAKGVVTPPEAAHYLQGLLAKVAVSW